MVTIGIIVTSVMARIQYSRITIIINVINKTNIEEIVHRITVE